MKNTLLLGRPLADHRIFCDNTCATANAVAQKLQAWILARCGIALPFADTHADAFIVIEPLESTAYGEGRLCTKNGCIRIQGNDIVGLTEAAAMLANLLFSADALDEDALCYRSTLQARECYEANADTFLPCYRHVYPSPKERTLAEKRAVLKDPAGRPFVIAHRGEHIFYPENSLESTISAWCCGADSVEIDIQKSADGVWMCMHDTDVTRTTNAGELLGKEGYPASPLLRDWSFDQLRSLRLKDPYGVQTPFLIPTLKEMLYACRGRIFAHLDKAFSTTEDIFPYMEKLGIYDCIYLVNHVGIHDILSQKDHFADRGIRLENLCRPRREMTLDKTLPVMLENLSQITPALIPYGDYVGHTDKITALIDKHKDRLRFGAWFLRDFDYAELWQRAQKEGISIFMTDHPLDLLAILSTVSS